ncbi:chloride channel protein [Parvularcula sp. LCG005]|uniref:chloride channel protein n=1 Tax=Parvularcula sp. LCG005 TaxID=3078805 RepID=UPI002942725D|nr:chloride channel protein [Parvularcula sp. LCG005]WOI54240.1 chloride channel protein [Parvularcula sp. LCG005]
MTDSPWKRIRLWLEHSAERAANVASAKVWLLAAAVGVLTSYGVLAFTVGIETLTHFAYGEGTTRLAQGARGLSPWRCFMVPVIGGVIVGFLLWLVQKLKIFPDIRCQGVAEVIEARASPPGHLSLAGGIANTIATGTALGFGASAGREGPLVLMGGAISTFLSEQFNLSGKDARTLLGCSAAAAVAAAFNAPIAGVLFALEVVLSNYALSVFGPVTLASVVSVLIARSHLGDLHRFIIPDYGSAGAYDIPLGAALGIICGLVAWTFLQSAAKGRRIARDLISKFRVPEPLLPVIAGLGMGCFAIVLPEVLGVGYEATMEAINGNYSLSLLLVLLVAKMVATILCLSCRFGTGVFSGGVYLGAITGAAFGAVLGLVAPDAVTSPTFYAMIGMGAVSGAIIGAPISTTLIVFELTGDYGMTAALMIAVGIATAIAQVFFGSSWFHYQLNVRGYDLSDGPQGVILQTIRVRDVMRAMPADAAPLEEGANRLYAMQTLGEALAVMTDLGADGMPVVASRDDPKIVGTLTQIRALTTYNKALVDSHIELHR